MDVSTVPGPLRKLGAIANHGQGRMDTLAWDSANMLESGLSQALAHSITTATPKQTASKLTKLRHGEG